MTNKLLEIDQLIEDSKNFNSTDIFIKELAQLLLEYLKIDLECNLKAIFTKEIEHDKKRFIAYCLLRVYCINSSLLTSMSIKHNVHSLIEHSLPEVYANLGLSNKSETYEIESKLQSYVSKIEKHVSLKVNSKFDLEIIKSYEGGYRSSINKNGAKPLLNAFFSDSFDKQYIENSFRLVKAYTASEVKDKYDFYNKAIEYLDSIIESSDEIGTKYCKEYISIPFTVIRKALISDFEANPFSKPAILNVKKTVKKYPFAKGSDYKLQLEVINSSTGYANETHVVIDLYSDDIIEINSKNQYIGTIKTTSIVEIPYNGISQAESILLYGYVEWTNFNGQKSKQNFEIELEGQRINTNWEDIEYEEPYDLEPVTEENSFIGRKQIISELKRVRKKVGSSYIYGQRRVGKTSIVKTLQSIASSSDMLFIYIEAGDWESAGNPNQSMNDLGVRICSKIKRHNQKFKSIEVPKFEGSFNRITEFLDEVTEIDNTFKVVIILDEFDRISKELLFEGEIAKSFVLTIRSISNREQFGFILVGGEKLEYILSQWQEFNKFKPFRVDYFNKKTEWEDFKSLIKHPIENLMEVSDKAIDYLYNQTSGNPYFTKKICAVLFSLMVSNRDSHITEQEARKATSIARDSNNIAATDFSHFWKDGIKEKEEESISIHRRKVLLSIGQIIKKGQKASKQMIIDKSIANGLTELQAEKTLAEFIQRNILFIEGNSYTFVVKFFEDWLISQGMERIITTFQEEQRIVLRQKYEEQLKVNHDELNKLTKSWNLYKGKEITTDIVRGWLEQFEGLENQRNMFKLLEHIKFYNNSEIREKMEDLFREVKKEIRRANKERIIKESQRKRDDILISYLDQNPAKSGAEYSKLFVEANNIYKDNSTTIDKLEKKIIENRDLNALVFIDDFIGSGNTIIENIRELTDNYKNLIIERRLIVIIGVITGFQEGKHLIEKEIADIGIPIKIIILDPLDISNKAFNSESSIFSKPIERDKTKKICYDIGLKLEKNHPLGYDDCQAVLVFPNTCPNNSLPILWKKTKTWNPIFERG
nr:ATP-binding protein [uncultured Carboxylicivirga sp.]